MKSKGITPIAIDHYIEETSLSAAWSRAFLMLASNPRREIVPLLLTLTGLTHGEPTEDDTLRKALDACLQASNHQTVHTVANTIFPQSIWRRAKGDRQKLFTEYLENLPTYVEMQPSKNGHGLYFSRLIGYGVDPHTGGPISAGPVGKLPGMGNQLEFLIQQCKPGVRRSMFQAAVFDPERDLTSACYQGFPCLQHVTFVPDHKAKTLVVNAFYATQQLFVKAYGNYLGLARLGAFFADQTGLILTKLNCFVGVAKMDKEPAAGPERNALITAAAATLQNTPAAPAPKVIG